MLMGVEEGADLTGGSVAVVVVNYNAGVLLSESVRGVLASTVPVEVFVVDNGSSDDSIEVLRERIGPDPRLSIVENGRNFGFAKAANIGLRRATSDFCLVLNPDCLVQPDTLEKVINFILLDPEVGVAGCMIRNPDGSEQAGGRRSVPTPWRSFVRVLHLDKWMPAHPRLRTFLCNLEPIPDRPIHVEAISGAFMLAPRKSLMQVGLLDEGYFMHCEDLDWCMRFRREGWKIMFVPNAEVVHYKGTCGKSRPVFVEWHKHRGMIRFYRTHFQHQYPWPLLILVFTAVWSRFALLASRSLVTRAVLRRVPESCPAPLSLHVAPREMTTGADVLRPDGGAEAEPFQWTGRLVLVTGGSGFIGRHLVEALVAVGAQVKVLARPHGKLSSATRRRSDHVEHRHGDLTEPGSLAGVCDGVDTIFHLAGYAHAEDNSTSLNESPHWRITVEGTQALLDHACAAGVKRLVFVSTVKAMGEGNDARLDETSPADPEDYYGMAKREAERLVLSAGQRCGVHTAVLRLPMVYGGHNAGNLSRMISSIEHGRFPPLPEVHNRRSMVHVDDVVQALLLAAERENANDQTYLITDDEVYSARRIYESICAALGRRPPVWHVPAWLLWAAGRLGNILRAFRLPAPLTTEALRKLLGSAWYCCEKAKRELGYRPRRKLEDSLAEMVADSRAQWPGQRT
jgi:nucleoside-diphosphate-sugar epimerase/GT2 family glycosyltransferase